MHVSSLFTVYQSAEFIDTNKKKKTINCLKANRRLCFSYFQAVESLLVVNLFTEHLFHEIEAMGK